MAPMIGLPHKTPIAADAPRSKYLPRDNCSYINGLRSNAGNYMPYWKLKIYAFN